MDYRPIDFFRFFPVTDCKNLQPQMADDTIDVTGGDLPRNDLLRLSKFL